MWRKKYSFKNLCLLSILKAKARFKIFIFWNIPKSIITFQWFFIPLFWRICLFMERIINAQKAQESRKKSRIQSSKFYWKLKTLFIPKKKINWKYLEKSKQRSCKMKDVLSMINLTSNFLVLPYFETRSVHFRISCDVKFLQDILYLKSFKNILQLHLEGESVLVLRKELKYYIL